MFKKFAAVVVAVSPLSSYAVGMDITALTSAQNFTDITAVGGAVFALIVAVKVIKFVRRAL